MATTEEASPQPSVQAAQAPPPPSVQAAQTSPQLSFKSACLEDLLEASEIAAEALGESPPYQYAYQNGTPSDRKSLLQFLFYRNFRMALSQDCCRAAFETRVDESGQKVQELVCFFMFVPCHDGGPQPGLCDFFRQGLFLSVWRFGWRPTWKLATVTQWAEGIEQEILQGRKVMRVEAMVVKASRQNLGVGTKALKLALLEADEQELEVFLATQEERSLPFYRRLGFELLREALHEEGNFKSWFMLRPPGGSVVA